MGGRAAGVNRQRKGSALLGIQLVSLGSERDAVSSQPPEAPWFWTMKTTRSLSGTRRANELTVPDTTATGLEQCLTGSRWRA